MNQTRWQDRIQEYLLPLLMLTLGLFPLGTAISKFFQLQELAGHVQSVKGMVIDFEEVCFDECGAAPIVKFTLQTGEVIQFTSHVSSSPRAYGVGDIVDVLYDLEDPKNAELSGAWNSIILISGAGGLFFTVIGVLSFISTHRGY
jgi:hypothetical protein